MTSGVYLITNLVNGKVYVGSSAYISKRWAAHKRALRDGNHHNRYLQSSAKKHGHENFQFTMLETCDASNEALKSTEQRYIDAYGSCERNVGYNLSPSAYNNLGIKFSEETRKRMSIAFKGRIRTPEHTANLVASYLKNNDNTGRKLPDQHVQAIRAGKAYQRRPVIQYSLGYKQIAEYECAGDAADALNVSRRIIGKACEVGRVAAGHYWCFKDNPRNAPVVVSAGRFRNVEQSDMEGNFLKLWKTLTQAAVELSFQTSGINKACNGVFPHYKGFKWRYLTPEEHQ